jgi:Tfp pilus assembly protein PilF
MKKTILITFVATFCLAFGEPDPLSGPEMKKYALHAVELGWEYFHKGDLDTALRRFQIAIREDPDCAPAYYGIAYVYSAEGKLDQAIEYYRETLKRDTSYPYTYANLGYALLQKGQEKEALQMLDKALALYPKCGEAHLSYANYYADKERWKDAENSANLAIDYGQTLDPEFVKLLEDHGVKLKRPTHSPDPTPASVTPAAGQPARQP